MMLTSALWLLACTEPAPTSSTDGPVATDPATPEDTGAPMDTGELAPPTPEPPFRPTQLTCSDPLPPLPDTFQAMPAFGPHEDFGFDATGYLVGVGTSGNLAGRNRQGDIQLISPGVGEAKGTRFLPNGDVALSMSAEGVIAIVHHDGQRETLANVPAPNGLTSDLLGNVWVSSGTGAIYRVQPEGGADIMANIGFSLDGIAFSPDFYRIYVTSEFGDVHYLELDENFEPIGDPHLLARVPLTLSLLDGMTTDMCGNVYVSRMDGRIFRYLPDGTPAGSMNVQGVLPLFSVTPALNFGSGAGGFERDHLYIMNFLGGVIEADIGIEGHWEPHYPRPE